jgi:hypothetical protein
VPPDIPNQHREERTGMSARAFVLDSATDPRTGIGPRTIRREKQALDTRMAGEPLCHGVGCMNIAIVYYRGAQRPSGYEPSAPPVAARCLAPRA